MIPYILLIFIPIIFQYVAVKKQGSRLKVIVGTNEYIQNNNLALNVFFLILLTMLILRHETVGKDLLNYKYLFIENANTPIQSFSILQPEVLFDYWNWLVGQFTKNYHIFLALMAALAVAPIAFIYFQDRSHSYLKLIIFVNMSTFIMLFSGIRQAWAMGLGMVAYHFVKKKKPVFFIIVCLIAMGVHTSAFMIFFMYPLYYANFKKKHLWYIIPSMLVVFVFNRQIFGFLGSVLSNFTEYSTEVSGTGAYSSLILFIAFLVLSYFITDESIMTREAMGQRNFLILCVIIQCFAPLHSLAMRMGYYYILFIPLAVSSALTYSKPKYRQIAILVEIVLCVFFTFMFVWSTYQSYVTGISALDTVPYRAFWAK